MPMNGMRVLISAAAGSAGVVVSYLGAVKFGGIGAATFGGMAGPVLGGLVGVGGLAVTAVAVRSLLASGRREVTDEPGGQGR
jgi:hypothetical protein